jgi:putative transposase
MADETINLNTAGDVVTETPAAVAPAKKTRAPRGSKKTAQPVSLMPTAATEKPAKKTRAKRGSKIAAATTEAPAAEVKKRATRQPRAKAAAPVTAVSTPALDDISDLLTLEEENKQLRKQLSEKLRAENADLRKRLGQN